MPRRLITENTLLKPIFTVMLAIVTACAQPTATLPSSPQPASQAAEAKPNNEGTLEQPKESVVIDPALLKASSQVAPDTYRVKLVTTKGDMLIRVERSWAPKGADRFYTLVKIGYFTDIAFFRVLKGYMAQFGIHGQPQVNFAWRRARIKDDEVRQSNTRGMVTFATAGKNSRTTQVFINYNNNKQLDAKGFAPFGEVIEGMEVLDSIYAGYGEGQPRGLGPNQGLMQQKGNEYLYSMFPKLDYIESAQIVP